MSTYTRVHGEIGYESAVTFNQAVNALRLRDYLDDHGNWLDFHRMQPRGVSWSEQTLKIPERVFNNIRALIIPLAKGIAKGKVVFTGIDGPASAAVVTPDGYEYGDLRDWASQENIPYDNVGEIARMYHREHSPNTDLLLDERTT